MRTTSGRPSRQRSTASTPFAAVPIELEPGLGLDHAAEPVAEHAVVVDDEDADHRRGTSSSTVVPAPGAERISSAAPEMPGQIAEERQPHVSLGRPRRPRLLVEPPSVVGHRQAEAAVVGQERDGDVGGCGVGDDVPDRLLRGAEDERPLLGIEPVRVLDRHGDLQAPCLERADEVGERRREALCGEVRRVQVDEEGAEVADVVPQLPDVTTELGRLLVGAARRRALREWCEPEGDAGDLLHGAVVEVRRDAPALAVGGGDRGREQALALLVAPLQSP